MEIKKKYFEKYLHNVAIEQIAEEYLQKGYSVKKEDKIGKYQADIVAKKGDETIVIEVKSGKMTPEKKEAITQLGNYIKSQGNYKFLVAIASAPREKKIEISNIEDLLFQEIIKDTPDELSELSTHLTIEDISDINIHEITINKKEVFAKGDGVINIQLQYGSSSDQKQGNGYSTDDSFPFDFEITLEYDDNGILQISDVTKLKIDTSSFFE